MKIALITGGQPRFTKDFIIFMNQLTGFKSADLYMVMWKSEWADNDETARAKIEKILLPNYNLKKIKVIEEPPVKYPPHTVNIAPPEPENIAWWFKRGRAQFLSLSLAHDLVDESYDAVIRFRLDGRLDRMLDVSKLSLGENFLTPSNADSGFDDFHINDQFAIGTQESMKFYFDFGKQYEKIVPIADPNWASDGVTRGAWTWSTEHLIGAYMKMHNKPRLVGDFNHIINTQGRSKFTDKHYHHRIVPDPTE